MRRARLLNGRGPFCVCKNIDNPLLLDPSSRLFRAKLLNGCGLFYVCKHIDPLLLDPTSRLFSFSLLGSRPYKRILDADPKRLYKNLDIYQMYMYIYRAKPLNRHGPFRVYKQIDPLLLDPTSRLFSFRFLGPMLCNPLLVQDEGAQAAKHVRNVRPGDFLLLRPRHVPRESVSVSVSVASSSASSRHQLEANKGDAHGRVLSFRDFTRAGVRGRQTCMQHANSLAPRKPHL